MWLELDGDGALNRQVYRALRAAILDGRLAPGARLPASRSLAADLGVSRNTILYAIEQLLAEGLAVARRGSGTFITEGLESPPRDASTAGGADGASAARLSTVGERIASEIPRGWANWDLRRTSAPLDFRYGEPAYSDLPLETWSRLLGRRARRLSMKRLAYQSPGGADELREALAGYLARARGVVCEPDQLLVVHGSQQAIDLTVRLLVDPGDTAVLEEPGYTGYTFCLKSVGARLARIPVDEEGLCVDALDEVGSARLACVTPSHQFPCGAILSLPRRLRLLEWATRHATFVLEDDYDGEFRYEGRPIPCLQSLDREGRVLYVGTASKMLFPSLRIGWLVVPRALREVFIGAKAINDTGTATLEELAFADFITEGHLERHIRRMRKRHAARRSALLEALDEHLVGRARIVGGAAGIHVLVRFEDVPASRASQLRAACRDHGVGVYPAAPYYERPPEHLELLLGYSALSTEQIRDGVARMARALDGVHGPVARA